MDDPRLNDWAQRGVATPDHVIRTKAFPLVLPAIPAVDGPGPDPAALTAWAQALERSLTTYITAYKAYFTRQNGRVGGSRTRLDPLPRVVAIPGLGLVGIGKSAADAAVTGDIAEAWAQTLLAAEAVGRFQPVGEDDSFDMEYWSLEQAKLGKGAEKPLARRVVLVTGGGGAIGAATARAFAAQGAEVAVVDLVQEAAEAVAAGCGKKALGLACDVTDPAQVRRAFDRRGRPFRRAGCGGEQRRRRLDRADGQPGGADLRACFELNFFAHQAVAQAAMAVFRAQDRTPSTVAAGPCWAGSCCSTPASRRSIPVRISGPTASARRPCWP